MPAPVILPDHFVWGTSALDEGRFGVLTPVDRSRFVLSDQDTRVGGREKQDFNPVAVLPRLPMKLQMTCALELLTIVMILFAIPGVDPKELLKARRSTHL